MKKAALTLLMLATFSYLYCANFKDMTNIERFLQKVYPEPNTGCWLWAGFTSDGYGRVCGKHGFNLAHRLSYFLHKGDFDRSLLVCHTCDNRLCVNPDHLWLGSNTDNIKDRDVKGRGARGMTHYKVKLNDIQVKEIREAYSSGIYTQLELSMVYGVSRPNIMRIVNRKSWTHI